MADRRRSADVANCTLQEPAIDYLPMAYAVALRLSGDRCQAELIARKTIDELSAHGATTGLKMKVLSLVRANFLSICGSPLGGACRWPGAASHGQSAN